jgi:hypothetical protein
MGRPSIPPSQLAKVMFLQHQTGVSDEQAMECVGWDLRWRSRSGCRSIIGDGISMNKNVDG